METEATTILIVALLYLTAGGLVLVWPLFGLALVLSILIVKVYLRSVMPGIMTGFTYDMGVVLLALLGAVKHRLWHAGPKPFGLPGGFVACWLLLALLMWLRLPGSQAYDYGIKKALTFSVFNTLVCLLCPLFVLTLDDARRILRMVFILGIISALSLIAVGEATESWRGARITVLGASPLGVADACVYPIVLSLSFWLHQRKWWQVPVGIAAVSLALYGIFLSGTRGPILAVPVVLLVVLWMHRRRIGFGSVTIGVAGAAVIALILVATLKPEMLFRFGSEEARQGLDDRVAMARMTFDGFLESPLLGNGTGDTAFQLAGFGAETYPHNHALEVANESGVVGLLAYVILMGYGLMAGWQFSKLKWDGTPVKLVGVGAFACFLYHLMMSMKTGTYSASFASYFWLSLTVVVYQLSRLEIVAHEER